MVAVRRLLLSGGQPRPESSNMPGRGDSLGLVEQVERVEQVEQVE